MSHQDPAAHGGNPASKAASGQTIFPPAELEAFHKEDAVAGRNIVCLMLTIFTLGLIGYLTVAYVVGS